MKGKTQQQKGVIALVLLAFGFGATAITARYLSFYFSLFQQLFLTLATAFVISLLIFPKSLTLKKLKTAPTKDWVVMFFRITVGYLIGASLYRESLTLTKVSNVSFIQSIPLSGLYGWLLFKEKFTFNKFLLLLTAFFGAALIAVDDFSSIMSFGRGELLSLISIAFFSLSFVARKWQSNFFTDKELAQISLFVGAVLMFVVSIINGEGLPPFSTETALVVSLGFSGFFNAINIFLVNYGFKNVKAVLASNIITLEAVFALILAYFFFSELPTLKGLVGGVIIIVSAIGMNKLEVKE